MCHLLNAFPGWEAIKSTRGHYRSCGKDPQSCCVSHLLTDEPVIRSGREETYSAGKDTGRYWDAGAANVHWLIVTNEQVEEGIKRTMERVSAAGVFIEGNSCTEFVPVDFMLMVARAEGGSIKASARRVLSRASGIYLSALHGSFQDANAKDTETANLANAPAPRYLPSWAQLAANNMRSGLPVYTEKDLPQLVSALRSIHRAFAA
jgi:hypothetical protein